MFDAIKTIILIALVAILMSSILIEWAMGCGESYYDKNGVVHVEQCGWAR